MDIVVIANGYPTKREPQYGCFEKEQAVALSNLGHKVSILYVDGRFRTYRRKVGITRIVDSNIEIYGLYYFPTTFLNKVSNHLQYWVRKKMLLKVFQRYLKTHEFPDIIYAHFLYNISCAVYLKEKYHIPLVGMEHWSVLNKEKLPVYARFRGQIAYQGADKIIAVSESLKQQIYKHFHKDSVVVHNMVAGEYINKSLPNNKFTGTFRLVAVGSLIHRKGFDILLNALSLLDADHIKWSLSIIGEGIERTRLQELIFTLNLGAKVQLLGSKTKGEVISILDQSDIFVFPSRSENFSVAVLEALSRGLPVIATICGGIKECINESNGILVPVEDSQALAKAIVDMCNNMSCYNRFKIAEDCKVLFSPDVIAKRLTNIFESVISK